MRKVMKKAISMMLAVALTVSGITYTQSVNAATEIDEWKAAAVKVPEEGALVAAGYIDVEFDNSMEGYTYEVYLDDKPVYWIGDDIVRTDIGETATDEAVEKTFTSEDEGKTEVYTTTVSKHELTVKARKDSEEVVSETRTFYVSKKGLALGGDMSNKISLKQLNCSWYYNWSTEAFNNSIDAGVSHIPMMWGSGDDNKEAMDTFNSSSNYILGFNEPDIETQANMFFADAIDTWKEYISRLNKRKVSPAPASPSGTSSWLSDFMNGQYKCLIPGGNGAWGLYSDYRDDSSKTFVEGIGEDVDAVCLHYYMATIDLGGLLNAVDNLWNTYHKPIWITEISVFGTKGFKNDYSYDAEGRTEEMAEYIREIVSNLDENPHVERYCWFAYDIDSANAIDSFDGSGATALFEYATGKYTPLGKLYSSIGNPEGYEGTDIQDAPEFKWEERVGADAVYNDNDNTVTVTWNTSDLNVARHEILIDDTPYDIENGSSIDAGAWKAGKHTLQFVLYDNEENILFNKTKKFTIERTETPTNKPEQNTNETTNETTTVEKTTQSLVTTTAPSPSRESKPAKVKLSKIKKMKKRSVKLTWKRTARAKKYQVQYALNKKFTKKVKSRTTAKLTIKIAKLAKKKIYYFRVRAINSAGKGKWSNIKKIKITK